MTVGSLATDRLCTCFNKKVLIKVEQYLEVVFSVHCIPSFSITVFSVRVHCAVQCLLGPVLISMSGGIRVSFNRNLNP